MEVILVKDIQGLGFKFDRVNVKPGYGRNYLIPQGAAIVANESNKKMTDEIARQAEHKAEKIKADAEDKKAKIEAVTLDLKAKVGDSGKIFGAITTLQVADALAAKGVVIDRKQIGFGDAIKEVGEYEATIALHKEVKATLKLTVSGE
jgi:large subunit ribosomal protein L9